MAPILGYWDIRGLATPIRLLLEHAGVEYEDKLYKCGGPPDFDRNDWLSHKFNLGLDFPNLPYFIDGDVKLSQSQVILRHLGRKLDMGGTTEAEKLRVDLAATQVMDFHMEYARIVYNPEFLSLKDGYTKTLPDKMKLLSDFLGKGKFILGDKVSYADFVLFEYLEGQLYFDKNVLKDFTTLAEFHKNVLQLDGVARYFNSPKAIKFPFNGAPAYFGGAHSEQLQKK